jgi:hypothetical protein
MPAEQHVGGASDGDQHHPGDPDRLVMDAALEADAGAKQACRYEPYRNIELTMDVVMKLIRSGAILRGIPCVPREDCACSITDGEHPGHYNNRLTCHLADIVGASIASASRPAAAIASIHGPRRHCRKLTFVQVVALGRFGHRSCSVSVHSGST